MLVPILVAFFSFWDHSAFGVAQETFKNFASGSRQFTAQLYTQIIKDHENFVASPLSVQTILALAQSGAKGNTGEEMRTALHLPDTKEDVEETFQELISTLTSQNHTNFHIANGIYVSSNYIIGPRFLSTAKNIYHAFANSVNFSQPLEVSKTINNWVENHTSNKIHDLVGPDSINENTVAILINAIYYQGVWLKPFKARFTEKKSFWTSSGDLIRVDTMKKGDVNGYHESLDLEAKFLKLAFKGGKVEMVFVLPDRRDGLKDLEKRMDQVMEEQCCSTLEFVHVTLPKFKIESSIDFKKVLKKLGVSKAFLEADFSGIAGNKGDIYISEVLQKSFMAVDEKGVEAASASAVSMRPKNLPKFTRPAKYFIADHPFLFYLRVNDVVVFIGRVLVP